jgi:hydrogenase nickel incorporation protein HypA/HybF
VHELALAESVLSIANEHARGRVVTKVELKVGHLRQVVPSALAFSFELLAQGTSLDGAELEIEEVPVGVLCRACRVESEPAAFPLCCLGCGSLDVDVIRGEELHVESLELEGALAQAS